MDDWFVEAGDVYDWVHAGAKLIDVRSTTEFASGAMPGAVHVPLQRLSSEIFEHVSAEDTVIFYCMSGALADRAATWLRSNGVEAAYNGGGIYSLRDGWAPED
ncbi:MAG: rhodanese-like domain-containing protein [Myxococcales bacterium]|nr:rhodanese-like domain-containing protein [Myxococcales bacterium]